MLKIKRALISVSDKTNLPKLAKTLKHFRTEIISTGGTRKLLKEQGISSRSVSEATGFPEILDGRVKTLHPKIHGGLLFRRNKAAHRKEAKTHGIEPIDMVVVNLYPFERVTAKSGTKLAEAVENIDIGGPAMIRAAAKNYRSVAVVCDPSDYDSVVEELESRRGALSEETLRRLAVKAFEHTAGYDRAISRYFREHLAAKDKELPPAVDLWLKKAWDLRYGENPHQRAALYRNSCEAAEPPFRQLQGKQLSYNNILDLEAALDLLREFREPCACVVKHNNPCGIAVHRDLEVAIEGALEGDPLSSFGGIVGVNRPLDRKATAMILEKLAFFELLVAPKIAPAALGLLAARKNLRVIEIGRASEAPPYELRHVKSGVLLQERDKPIVDGLERLRASCRVVTKTKLSPKDLETLLFAWACAKVVRSNAIVLVQGKKTVGIGCGQMSRVDSVKIACEKAGSRAEGSLMASDGFFPMPDNIMLAHEHKVRAIIQPGGSIRDPEVIEACDHYGIAMVFTGERHFKH